MMDYLQGIDFMVHFKFHLSFFRMIFKIFSTLFETINSTFGIWEMNKYKLQNFIIFKRNINY